MPLTDEKLAAITISESIYTEMISSYLNQLQEGAYSWYLNLRSRSYDCFGGPGCCLRLLQAYVYE